MKLVELGEIVITNLCMQKVKEHTEEVARCVVRHKTGDWGNLCEEDKQLNDSAVVDGGRILSAYEIGENKVKIWIITEADRSYTTILLPEEY